MTMKPLDFSDAYANMKYVQGSDALPDLWAGDAENYRNSGISIEQDIPYGDGDRQKLDIVFPDGKPKGLAVFVHGGYWMRLYKSYWTQFAEGARANGWAVALPGYTLTPQARIADITVEISTAISCAAQRVAGPIRIAGHSAGGHLVSRLACTNTELDTDTQNRIEHILSISGLHDLRPLMHTDMNQTLNLGLAEARAESPALLEPRSGVKLTAWVGGGERPEFLRQAHLLDLAWQSFDVQTSVVVDSVHHHFSVLEDLKNPDSAITKAFVGQ